MDPTEHRIFSSHSLKFNSHFFILLPLPASPCPYHPLGEGRHAAYRTPLTLLSLNINSYLPFHFPLPASLLQYLPLPSQKQTACGSSYTTISAPFKIIRISLSFLPFCPTSFKGNGQRATSRTPNTFNPPSFLFHATVLETTLRYAGLDDRDF